MWNPLTLKRVTDNTIAERAIVGNTTHKGMKAKDNALPR